MKSDSIKISGIYMIRSLRKPDRIYIGSAGNIYKRWYYHSRRLLLNIHENKRLQNHYNKYGKEDLIFTLMLGCDKSDLISVEQYFLDVYNPFFNICKKAYSSLGRPPWNKGIKTGISNATSFKKGNIPWSKGKKYHIKVKRIMSDNQKEKIRISMRGKKNALKRHK